VRDVRGVRGVTSFLPLHPTELGRFARGVDRGSHLNPPMHSSPVATARSGIRDSGFGFRVSGFGVGPARDGVEFEGVLGLGFRVSGVGCRV